MELKIIEKKEMPLLSRKRITIAAHFEKETPKREEVRKAIAKLLGTDEKLTVIRHIYTKFGKREAKIITHVYDDEKEMLRVEDKITLSKHLGKENKKEEASKESTQTTEKTAEVN